MYSFRRMQAILFNQSLLLDDITNINIVITCGMETLERLEKKKAMLHRSR